MTTRYDPVSSASRLKPSRMPARNPFSGVKALSDGSSRSSPNVAMAWMTGGTLRQPPSLSVYTVRAIGGGSSVRSVRPATMARIEGRIRRVASGVALPST
jgi:hypothetical protein